MELTSSQDPRGRRWWAAPQAEGVSWDRALDVWASNPMVMLSTVSPPVRVY